MYWIFDEAPATYVFAPFSENPSDQPDMALEYNKSNKVVGFHWRTTRSNRRVDMQLSRVAVANRHWVRQIGTTYTFVSRPLAEQLEPLLPRGTTLIPIGLTTSKPWINPADSVLR